MSEFRSNKDINRSGAEKFETKDVPKKGKRYNVVFKKPEAGEKLKVKYRIPGTNSFFKIVPYDWQPREGVSYEVELMNLMSGTLPIKGGGFLGTWPCRAVDSSRDNLAHAKKEQQRIFDEAKREHESQKAVKKSNQQNE